MSALWPRAIRSSRATTRPIMAVTRRSALAGRRAQRAAKRGARVGGTLALLLWALPLSGCDAPDFLLGVRGQSEYIAQSAGLAEVEYPAGRFRLLAYEHFEQPGADMAVYIESDGFSWLDRHTLSADPTPAEP